MEAKVEEIDAWADELRASCLPVVVEGKKDKRTLAAFGIKKVTSLDKPLYAVVESIAEKEKQVVILTDFDKKGKQLYGKLKKDLASHGVQVDHRFREFLQQKTKISHIEGLKAYRENMDQRTGKMKDDE